MKMSRLAFFLVPGDAGTYLSTGLESHARDSTGCFIILWVCIVTIMCGMYSGYLFFGE